jgi:Leucine-rich repeat (LRR) protein
MAAFDSITPSPVTESEWTVPAHVWLAEAGPVPPTPILRANEQSGEDQQSVDRQAQRLFKLSLSAGTIDSVESLNLDLRESAIPDLQGLSRFGALKSLWLEGDGVADYDLAHMPALPHLEELLLSNNPDITDEGVKHLESFHGLKTLSLIETNVSDEVFKSIAGFQSLESLSIGGRNLTGEGLSELTALPHLTSLSLSGNSISADGLAALKDLPALTELYLGFANVGDETLEHLKSLTKLRTLQVPMSMSDEAVAELKKALPDCDIY